MARMKLTGEMGPSAKRSCPWCDHTSTPTPNAGGRGTTQRPMGYKVPVKQIARCV